MMRSCTPFLIFRNYPPIEFVRYQLSRPCSVALLHSLRTIALLNCAQPCRTSCYSELRQPQALNSWDGGNKNNTTATIQFTTFKVHVRLHVTNFYLFFQSIPLRCTYLLCLTMTCEQSTVLCVNCQHSAENACQLARQQESQKHDKQSHSEPSHGDDVMCGQLLCKSSGDMRKPCIPIGRRADQRQRRGMTPVASLFKDYFLFCRTYKYADCLSIPCLQSKRLLIGQE